MIRYFTEHPTAANLLMLIFVALGVTSLSSLKRETFPEFAAAEVEIRVVYPGATAEDVEEAICARIEDAIDGVNDVAEVTSEAREGMGTVTVEMAEGGEFLQFLDDINTELDSIDDFPDVTEKPVIRELNRTDQVVSIAVTGPMGVSDLKALCEEIKDRLQSVGGVSLVEVSGFSEHQIRIEVDAEAALGLGVSVSEIADVIRRQSVNLPAGSLETQERDILLRFDDERRSPHEFEDLVVIGGSAGAEIRLGEIARVSDVFELDEVRILFDGRRAGVLSVTKTKSEDTLEVMESVEAFLEAERPQLPPGVELTLTQDVSSIVADRLRLLTKNGLQGLLLVFLVLSLFFRIRFAFWVAVGLPISFLGAFYLFPLLGVTINMISMVGLLLGLGLLMDDAIVLSENVAAHLKRGEPLVEGVVGGIKEVSGGVISSFLTTVVIFGMITSLEGQIGRVLSAMPIVLILVLAVSLVEAFLILPHHLAHALHGHEHDQPSRVRLGIERVIDGARERAGRIADTCVRWRYLTLGVTVMIFLLSLAMVAGGVLKFQAFPEIDGDVVEARLLLPQGTPLHRTEAIVERLTEALDRVNEAFRPSQPDGQDLIRHVSARFNSNSDSHEEGPHVATVSADLLPAENRSARIDDILNLWREEVGEVTDVIALTFTEPSFGPAGRAVDIRLHATTMDELSEVSHELETWLGTFVGVNDIAGDLRPGKPEIRLRLREGAMALGLNAEMIASQLRAAFYGSTASEIQVGTESYEIDVRLAEADRDGWEDVQAFHINLTNGRGVPLEAVATVEQGRSWARIVHVDGLRTANVTADVDTSLANTNEIIGAFRREFVPRMRESHPYVTHSFQGEVDETSKARDSMLTGLILGLFGVFAILSFQFRGYVAPLIVMVAIPLCLIGVIWGHLAMGLPLTMPSVLGFVSLAGVVVNDSLLLVLFIRKHVGEGMSVERAAPQASRERFRAVLLTSLTTVAGLLPLLFERSLQAQILIPLATSLVFGLLASTLLVILVVPALYSILEDLGVASRVQGENEG